jgi:hypothetical protein
MRLPPLSLLSLLAEHSLNKETPERSAGVSGDLDEAGYLCRGQLAKNIRGPIEKKGAPAEADAGTSAFAAAMNSPELNLVHVAQPTGKRAHYGNSEVWGLVHEEEEGFLANRHYFAVGLGPDRGASG